MKRLSIWTCLLVGICALATASPLLSGGMGSQTTPIALCSSEDSAHSSTRSTCQNALRIATFNIHHGRGQDGTVDLQRVSGVAATHDIDVLFLNEVDLNWPRSGREDQTAVVGILAEMEHVLFAPALRLLPWLGTLSPAYGNALASRFPWTTAEQIPLPRLGKNEPRNLLLARLAVNVADKDLILMGTHLSTHREERLAQIKFIVERFPLDGEPMLLVGDFNSQPDQADMQMLFDAGWVDLWAVLGKGEGFTFPSDQPRHRIDYVLASPEVARAAQSIVVANTLASDHLPVIVTLDLSLL